MIVYGFTQSLHTQRYLRDMRDDPRLKGKEGEESFFRYVDFGDFGHPKGAPFIPGHVLDGIRKAPSPILRGTLNTEL